MDKNTQSVALPLSVAVVEGVDMDNDILLKVTTCGFSFYSSATSVSLQHGEAGLPACPLVGAARR